MLLSLWGMGQRTKNHQVVLRQSWKRVCRNRKSWILVWEFKCFIDLMLQNRCSIYVLQSENSQKSQFQLLCTALSLIQIDGNYSDRNFWCSSDTSKWIHMIRTCLERFCRTVLLKEAECLPNLKIDIHSFGFAWNHYEMSYNILAIPIFHCLPSLFFLIKRKRWLWWPFQEKSDQKWLKWLGGGNSDQ